MKKRNNSLEQINIKFEAINLALDQIFAIINRSNNLSTQDAVQAIEGSSKLKQPKPIESEIHEILKKLHRTSKFLNHKMVELKEDLTFLNSALIRVNLFLG